MIDFRDDDGTRDVLTQTESDGLLGGTLLADRPPASYLEAEEEPKYLLQNKKSGLTITADSDSETIEPDGDHRALALATDLRLLVVVGDQTGDTSRSLALSEVVEADADAGLRSGTLVIETLSEGRWEFPCRDDPTEVADYLEDAAQAWANAGRLLDELEEALHEAEDNIEHTEYQAAAELVTGGEETIKTAKTRGTEIGAGAHARIADRADMLGEWLRDIRREITAAAAASEHARAHDEWRAGSYEAAAKAYDRAIDTYHRALDIDGSDSSDDSLRARLRASAAERELLRVGPFVDADTARREAASLSDSEAAAEKWEQALAGYRALLTLEWGSENRAFVTDRERVREQTVEIADDAIDDHLDAGTQWLRPGDELSVDGNDHDAEELYKMARHQFEQAHRLASEVRPDRVEEIEEAIDAVETRLDGNRPREAVPEDPLTTAFDDVSDQDEQSPGQTGETPESAEGGEATLESSEQPIESNPDVDEFDQLSFPSAGTDNSSPEFADDATTGPSTTGRTETESNALEDSDGPSAGDGSDGAPPEDRTDESSADEETEADSGGSLLDEIQSGGNTESTTESTPSEEPRTDGARPTDQYVDSDGYASSNADIPGIPPGLLSDRLRQLDADALTDVVAAVYERTGWETQVFDGKAEATYDIVASQGDDRKLIWTLQRSDGGDVGEALLRRCSTTLENSTSADEAVVVTTGGFTHAAAALSGSHQIETVDCDALVDRVDSVDLSPETVAILRG